MSEKTTLKSYEVTIQKTITYESEAEAEKLAMGQVEAGDHDDTFLDNLQDENWEVTETNCTSEDDE